MLFAASWARAAEPIPPGPWDNPPPLPKSAGTVVTVRAGDAEDLQAKVRQAKSNTTVVVPAGTYKLNGPLRIGMNANVRNVAVRGATGQFKDVVILGKGMRNESGKDTVPHCVMVENAQDVLIADVTLGDVWFHPVTLQGPLGADRVRIYHCRLFDAGEQFVKSNPARKDGSADPNGYTGPSQCAVEYCVIEFTDTARWWYTEGVDVHAGRDWVVRRNLFRNIRGPAGSANVGGAIDFWNHSSGTVAEGNTILNCAVGIRFGIVDKAGATDHEGGIIRNNFIYRARGACIWADVGIVVNDSPNTKVVNNTIIFEDDYPNAIEYRFPDSKGLLIANNLTNKAIRLRDGAQAVVQGNDTKARPDWFRNPALGDLRLNARGVAGAAKVPGLPDCPLDFDGRKRAAGKPTCAGADSGTGK